MKRFLMILALGGIVLTGCKDDDDDDDDDTTQDGGSDSGRPDGSTSDGGGMDGGRDSGVDSSVAAKVTNPGAACTTAAQCMGPAAQCSPTIAFSAPAPGGGVCTAMCTTANDCGSNGACPFGDLFSGAFASQVRGGFNDAGLPNALLDLSQKCLQKCSAVGASGCPTGYKCSSVVEEIPTLKSGPLPDLLPSVNAAVCIPMGGIYPPMGGGDAGVDGGARDSGVADASGMDSST